MNPERWQKVVEFAEAAAELGAAERATFLEKACAGDEGLRREVESLLLRVQQAQGVIEAPALTIAAG
jgi:serine/threonine-protein kinase